MGHRGPDQQHQACRYGDSDAPVKLRNILRQDRAEDLGERFFIAAVTPGEGILVLVHEDFQLIEPEHLHIGKSGLTFDAYTVQQDQIASAGIGVDALSAGASTVISRGRLTRVKGRVSTVESVQ